MLNWIRKSNTKITISIIFFNVVFFIVVCFDPFLMDVFGLIPGNLLDGEIFRIITAGFTHSNIAHLMVNMASLYTLGSFTEEKLGSKKFVFYYLVCVICGNLFVFLFSNRWDNTVGASGALFGLIGLLLLLSIHDNDKNIKRWLVPNLIINVANTFFSTEVSTPGHLGGLVAGLFLGWVEIQYCGKFILLPYGKKMIPKTLVYSSLFTLSLIFIFLGIINLY